MPTEQIIAVLKVLALLWVIGFVATGAFFGFVLFFKQGLLDSGEVFDRACDGRWFRDALVWPFHFVGLLVPVMLVAAAVYPFAFTLRRLQTLGVRRYRQR